MDLRVERVVMEATCDYWKPVFYTVHIQPAACERSYPALPDAAACLVEVDFELDGTDHPSPREEASMIRRCIAWRNRHATDSRLRKAIRRARTSNERRLPERY